jgi:hypothetical protein
LIADESTSQERLLPALSELSLSTGRDPKQRLNRFASPLWKNFYFFVEKLFAMVRFPLPESFRRSRNPQRWRLIVSIAVSKLNAASRLRAAGQLVRKNAAS